MKRSGLILLIITFCFSMVVLSSCKKDNGQDVDRPLIFENLVAENDTIPFLGSTKITATADGDGIEYLWSVADGNIVGSGAEITYTATPCVAGNMDVSCTVKDKGNNELSKTVRIFVQL
jgi:hypothetical protein